MLNNSTRNYDLRNVTQGNAGEPLIPVSQIGNVQTDAMLGYSHSMDTAMLKANALDVAGIYVAGRYVFQKFNLMPGTAIGKFFGNENEATTV